MLLRLFLLFTLVPITELWLLIRIGGLIGLPATLALVLFTGAAGAALARREGLRSWLSVQGELADGRLPGTELVHGVLILIAGIVLLTPGVLTDLMGLALLIRPIRRRLIARLRKRFEQQLEAGTAGFVGGPGLGVFWGGGMPGGEPRAGRPDRPGGEWPGVRDAGGPEPEERPAAYPRGREIIVESPPDESG
jgi:UPF0716 protein FxsA